MTRKRKSKHLTPEQIEELARRYPNESNEELAKSFGVSVYTIKSRKEKHGWNKSREYTSRLYSKIAKENNNAARINTPEAYAKRENTIRERFASDRIRIKWGLDPVWKKRHYRREPRAKLLQRNRLQRLGYIVDETNLIAYYTPGTHRAKRLEAIPRGTTKGNIHPYYDFRPYAERELDK